MFSNIIFTVQTPTYSIESILRHSRHCVVWKLVPQHQSSVYHWSHARLTHSEHIKINELLWLLHENAIPATPMFPHCCQLPPNRAVLTLHAVPRTGQESRAGQNGAAWSRKNREEWPTRSGRYRLLLPSPSRAATLSKIMLTLSRGIERGTLGRRTERSTGIVVITNHDVASSTYKITILKMHLFI